MARFSYQDFQIDYQLEGEGPAVALIHGFGEDSGIWIELRNMLVKQYQVLTMDLPGFGSSPLVKSYSIRHLSEILLRLIESQRINKVAILGHSMGGYINLAIAEINPGILSGFGLIHSHPFEDSEDSKKSREKGIDFINKYGSAIYAKQMIPGLFSERYVQNSPGTIEKMISIASTYPAGSFTAGQRAMLNRPDRAHVLSNLEVPVLLVAGTEDKAIPEEYIYEQLHLPKRAILKVYPGIGHMAMVENSAEFLSDVLEYLTVVYSE